MALCVARRGGGGARSACAWRARVGTCGGGRVPPAAMRAMNADEELADLQKKFALLGACAWVVRARWEGGRGARA